MSSSADPRSNELLLFGVPDSHGPLSPTQNQDLSSRWGVILAGGEGTRLLSLTRKITGDDRPKQFCALTGVETLLEQTRRRVSQVVAERHALLILTKTHERFYKDQLRDVPARNLLVQPFNRGTAPAIAYSLTHLNSVDREALVGFFPSDHHFESDGAFAVAVSEAFEHAAMHGDHVLLLGIAPESPEEGYGWIEPGARLHCTAGGSVFEVRRFWEKPSRETAKQLMSAGGLWNTFIMVGRVSAFLSLIRHSLPDLLAPFESMWAAIQPGTEDSALENLFSKIPASNFSHDVLSAHPSGLAVVRVHGLGWTDLGEPERVLSTLQLPRRRGGSRRHNRVSNA
jgi:mannose-1-phosphate guanylyltransferase